jgi:hypothetical protein
LACLSQALGTGGNIQIGSGAVVDGYNSSQGAYGSGNQGLAANIQAGGTITNNGRVAGTLVANTSSGSTPIPSPALTPLGTILVNSNQTLALPAGEYGASSLTINSNGTLRAQGQVRIWVTGAVTINGTAQPANGQPNNLWIILTGSGPFQVNSGGLVLGVVDAPLATAMINGTLEGGLVAASATLNSGASIHFDTQTSCGNASGGVHPALAKQMGKNGDCGRSGKSVIVAPNPCRGSATLWYTLAQEVQVQVMVYSIDGQRVYWRALGTQHAGRQAQNLDLNGLADGIYILKILQNGQASSNYSFKLAIVR